MSLLASFLFESVGRSGFTSNFSENTPAAQSNPEDNEPVTSPNIVGALEESLRAMVAPTSADAVQEDDSSSFGGQTILSSAPSDTLLDVSLFRVGQTDNYPWPTPIQNYPHSVSTASSCYIDMDDMEEEPTANIPRQESFASLSFHASSMDSSVSVEHDNLESTELVSEPTPVSSRVRTMASFPSLDGYHSALPLHSTAFVLPQLLCRPRDTTSSLRRQLQWYAQFDENDWENLRQRAQVAMRALEIVPPRRNPLRPFCLPPCPPEVPPESVLAAHPTVSLQAVGVPSSVPDCFVCVICQGVIVGALTLDCDCGTTVCWACWEYRSVTVLPQGTYSEDSYSLARELDYEIVSTHLCCSASRTQNNNNNKCPCCWQSVHNPVPCHALDVAILQFVQSLGSTFQQFQQLYYERLWCWRDEVVQRQQEDQNDDGCVSDAILAKMIQDEEKIFYRVKTARTNVWAPGAIGFFVAMVASLGIGILTQRRAEGRFPQIGGNH